MPKLNVIHRLERLSERIAQLENNEAIEAREINSLLTNEQKELLKKLWAEQQKLRKQSPPKTEEDKKQLGWKTKREIRIDVLKQALLEMKDNSDSEIDALKQQSEAKAAKVFLDAYFDAKDENKNAWAKGNAALQRAGFSRINEKTGRYEHGNNAMNNNAQDKYKKEMLEMEEKIRNMPNTKKS